jgi:hypothetical protein
MNPILRLSLAAVLVASLAACGGFSSGLPGNTPLRDLTNDQAEQFCEAVNDYFDGRVDETRATRIGCYITGMVATFTAEGDPQEACVAARDACLAEEDDDEADCSGATAPACDATVSDLESCIEDSVDANNRYLRDVDDALSYSCDPDDFDDDFGVFEDIDFEDYEPESCKAVDETCD